MGTKTESRLLQNMTMAQLEAEFDKAMAEASLPRVQTCIHAAVKAVDNESHVRDAAIVVVSLEFLMGACRRISTRFGNSDPEATKKLLRQIRVIIIKNYTSDFFAPHWVKNGALTVEDMFDRRANLVVAFFAEYGFAGLDSKDTAGMENYLRGLWQKRESSKATGHAPVELVKTTINAGAFGLLTHFRVFEAIPYIFNSLDPQRFAFHVGHGTSPMFLEMPIALHPIILESAVQEKIQVVSASVLSLEGKNPSLSENVLKGARTLLELLAQYKLQGWELGQTANRVFA